MQSNAVIGSYTGNGSTAEVVDLGFRPKKVEIVNSTDGDKLVHIFDNGGAGKALLVNDSGSGTTDLSIVAEPLITNRGFTTGTNANLIESAKVFLWIAYR
jgi:hypothetical protein